MKLTDRQLIVTSMLLAVILTLMLIVFVIDDLGLWQSAAERNAEYARLNAKQLEFNPRAYVRGNTQTYKAVIDAQHAK